MPNYAGKPICQEIAGKYALYAMAASNCYHNSNIERFNIDAIDWMVVGTQTHPNGLSYDILEKHNSNKTIIAFRGTDTKLDHLTANFAFLPLTPLNQYTQAVAIFKDYRAEVNNRDIVVCGHSLGGSLALSISVRYGVPAVTFNSSPRIFDGIKNRRLDAKRVLIYEDGEILDAVRRVHQKYKKIIPEENVYRCSFNFDGNQHRGDKLARALLELGAKANPALRLVCAEPITAHSTSP